jgi:hypothetical protein
LNQAFCFAGPYQSPVECKVGPGHPVGLRIEKDDAADVRFLEPGDGLELERGQR